MSEYKDLNELISFACQINEGHYDVIDTTLSPTSELFTIAQYFAESIKKLKSVQGAVASSYDKIPAFEESLKEVAENSRQASLDVLSLVDKVNFNIDSVKELIADIDLTARKGDFAKAAGLCERLSDLLSEGQELSFDIVSSLEFKELSRSKLDSILEAVSTFEAQLAELVISLGIKKHIIDSDTVDKLKEPKQILQDQTLVNKLLKEFGL